MGYFQSGWDEWDRWDEWDGDGAHELSDRATPRDCQRAWNPLPSALTPFGLLSLTVFPVRYCN